MTRRRVEEENIRKIQKMRRSYYVSLPIDIIRRLRWQAGQNVTVEERGKEIVIKDWEK
ncbi:MAG: AbrB/MazE/SpoVT family DNA-binding domain-containing protein [Patescibacteria group bacterium]|nr:AbrB/MazE/SpoVT family DNA-binding domain-containing protein [Patescibacteria group bacterium]